MKFIISILLSLFALLGSVNAQKGWEIGGWAGAAHYFGDLNTNYSLNDPGIALGVLYRRNFNNRVSFNAGIDYGRVRASDEDSNNAFEKQRNLSFKSYVFGLSSHLEFNFFTYVHGDDEYYFTPYIFLGGGITKFNPVAELDGTKYNLKDFGTEGQFVSNEYQAFTANFSFGVGFKWDVNRKWSFNVFLTPKKLVTDYFDDVSGTYPNLRDLRNSRGDIASSLSDRSGIEGFAEEGTQRGNSRNNDTYAYLGISFMRYFSQLECPKVSRIKGK